MLGWALNAPHLEGHRTFNAKDCRLPELKCDIWNGFIFVSLDADPPGLTEQFSELDKIVQNYHLEDMQLRYLADEYWDLNWKCLLENFMEGYHITPLHKNTLDKVTSTRLCTHIKPGSAYAGIQVLNDGFGQ